jgi:hypothetical protein
MLHYGFETFHGRVVEESSGTTAGIRTKSSCGSVSVMAEKGLTCCEAGSGRYRAG